MSKMKVLSSNEILSILYDLGFEKISQKGSHIKLVRQTNFKKEILIIPNHKTLSKGTVKAIYNQACKFVSQEKLSKFYTE